MRRVAEDCPEADLEVFAATAVIVRLATRLIQDVEKSVHRPAGWNYAGFRVLFTLWIEGELEPRDIALYSGLSRAAVSSTLNKLEADGLITRSRESSDRRLVTTRLTDTGRSRLISAYSEDNARNAELFGDLSESELRLLTKLCGRLLETPRSPND